MSSLVQTLQRQHQEIQRLAARLDERVASGDVAGVTEALQPLKVALLEHLALEDSELYPGLIRLAEERGQEHVALVGRTFSGNMAVITQGMIGFLEHYEQVTDLPTFTVEWHGKLDILRKLIASEESNLYPLYERVREGASPQPAA